MPGDTIMLIDWMTTKMSTSFWLKSNSYFSISTLLTAKIGTYTKDVNAIVGENKKMKATKFEKPTISSCTNCLYS